MRRLISREMLWLLQQMRTLWRYQVLSLSSILLGTWLTVLGPLVLRWLIDTVLRGHNVHMLLLGTLGYGTVLAGELGFSYFGFFISYFTTEKLAFRIRLSRLRKLAKVSAAYQESMPPGEMQYRIEQDIDRIGELGADIFPTITRMAATGILVLITMALLNVRLTLLLLPLMPVFYLLQKRSFASLAVAADLAQRRLGNVSAVLQEHLLGLIQLQLLNRTAYHRGKLARLAAESVDARVRQRLSEIRFSASSMSVMVLGSTVILCYGGYEVMHDSLTVGGLVAFYSYVGQLLQPMSIAVDLQSRIQRVAASIRRVLELGEESGSSLRANPGMESPSPTTALQFKGVSFSHSQRRPAICEIDLHLCAHEKVALVGHSGSGKSTILCLAAGLYAPDQGHVWVSGEDIAGTGSRRSRGSVALVPQEPVLFAGSLRENILYGNPRATSRQLEEVVAAAQLEDVLMRLPQGLDEPLGNLGRRLSGGEKKRVALARALLQEADILMLDEVTAALDEPTASRLLQSLDRLQKGRAILLVSHKASTISWADRIVLLDRGRIVESGTHFDLLKRSELYRQLYSGPAVHRGFEEPLER